MRQVIFAIVLLAVGAGAFYVYDRVVQPRFARQERPPNGPDRSVVAPDGREVVALGRLEPAEGVVSVAATPGEWLQKINVSEGDVVEEEGASLGVLASHELRQVELEGLRAQLAAAEESHQANLHVAEARLAQAQAALQQAEGNRDQALLQEQEIQLLQQRAELARSEFDQLAELASEDPDLVTARQLERQRLAWQTAQSEFQQAQRSLIVTQRATELAVEAARADVAAAEATLQQTQAAKSLEVLAKQVEAAAVQERWARLPAPTPGAVLKVYLRPGEFISQTPILQLADLSQMVCIAEVFEADAKILRVGDEAVISSNAFRAPFDQSGIRGTVTRVRQLVEAPGIATRDPLARADRHVVEVVVAINPSDEQATQQAASLVGLQVSVQFLTAQSD